ncbi:glycerol-3-phosphate dehydrogenase/oxidase [Prochlorococcus sp. MIT 1341]|uniref:glycerol-3-phosphate dehydrogenase/oxidase n=1 Tax=Prochlorococcus sp. MIT 1341 TaxID=3096221 RepID=UPI002A75ACFB|nr:glycerol-3-phosphate dehydrogenase/oxidase [Prochlorococcus sp. MIT 1341]
MTHNTQNFDLLVIGAGATGSCLAYEASCRGLKVALLDSGDIGGGTSCRSTKLLHGGVRYLELAFKTFDLAQLKLVREALLEREYWLKQVPFLTRRIDLVLPTESLFQKGYYQIGLGIYDALAGERSIAHSRILSKKQLKIALPFLREDLNGGVAYSDGQFDDARLNLLLALTAKRAGAFIKTRCQVIEFEKNANGKLCAAISEDSNGQQNRWNAKAIVNATGIYSDRLRQIANSSVEQRMLTSRGVHLVTAENLCPQNIGLIIPKTNDGRVVFALPFHGRTLVGTTDKPCHFNEVCQPSEQEKNYLINYIRSWFPKTKKHHITSEWSGGRPLLKPLKERVQTSRVVREHEIEILPCGLISAMGGKWTTCRPIALDTLKAVEEVMSHELPKRKQIPIIGSTNNPSLTIKLLYEHKEKLKLLLPNNKLQDKQTTHLLSNYGLEALPMIENTPEKDRQPLSNLIPICKAEFKHWIENEYAQTPTDMLARRCRVAMIDIKEAKNLSSHAVKALRSRGLPTEKLTLEDNPIRLQI